MRKRPDLLDHNSPQGIEVVQLTDDPDVPSCHIYMEAQVFTLDSKRFILHRSAHAHGSDSNDPKHQFLICDIENNCELSPITEETGATAPSMSPDGRYLYYFVDETSIGGGQLTLKRVNIDSADRQTVLTIDSPLDKPVYGVAYRPSVIYPLSTISSDGKRLALSAFLGDGQCRQSPYGLLVFDIERGTVDLVAEGANWWNMHPQYSRSLDPQQSHDLLVQDDHGILLNEQGRFVQRDVDPRGVDIHVMRDDGTNMRTMPFGRDGNEFCQGHQCWRGRSDWAITSTATRDPDEWQLIEGHAMNHPGHLGRRTPGTIRNDLSCNFTHPLFYHFAVDLPGNQFISDCGPFEQGGHIYFGTLGPKQANVLVHES